MEKEIEAKAKANYVPPPKGKRSAPTKAGRKILRTIREDLPVPLTDGERAGEHANLLKLLQEAEVHIAHEKQVKADLRARKEMIASGVSVTRMRLDQGVKLAPVDVQLEADFKEGVARYIRGDTGAILRTRPLDPSERQEPLEYEGEKSTPAEEDAAKPLEND